MKKTIEYKLWAVYSPYHSKPATFDNKHEAETHCGYASESHIVELTGHREIEVRPKAIVPEQGDDYFSPCLFASDFYSSEDFDNEDKADRIMASRGLCFPTKEDAIEIAQVMIQAAKEYCKLGEERGTR